MVEGSGIEEELDDEAVVGVIGHANHGVEEEREIIDDLIDEDEEEEEIGHSQSMVSSSSDGDYRDVIDTSTVKRI